LSYKPERYRAKQQSSLAREIVIQT
jgi:hypothetical protein